MKKNMGFLSISAFMVVIISFGLLLTSSLGRNDLPGAYVSDSTLMRIYGGAIIGCECYYPDDCYVMEEDEIETCEAGGLNPNTCTLACAGSTCKKSWCSSSIAGCRGVTFSSDCVYTMGKCCEQQIYICMNESPSGCGCWPDDYEWAGSGSDCGTSGPGYPL